MWPGLLGTPTGYLGVTKIAQKGRFFGLNFCLRSKFEIIFEKLKYFLGYGPIFEKKCEKGQKRVKIGIFGFSPYFTLFYPIFPVFPYFGPDLGLLKAARRWDGD